MKPREIDAGRQQSRAGTYHEKSYEVQQWAQLTYSVRSQAGGHLTGQCPRQGPGGL